MRAWRALMDHFPLGAGFGTFETLYPSYEDPATITNTLLPHAHNDFLEFGVELGLAGGLVLLFCLGWWAVMTARTWSAPRGTASRLKKAATIAIGAVIAHSAVDFPLRSEAISCLGALCLGLMASDGPARSKIQGETSAFQHRHIEI